jgi:formate hydrogenlyase subunit 3/multisubunit Na+/H+ antiporter MnhD subunit
MQALKQEQSKRLLAFHSIGQVGYILLGTGACMSLLAAGTPIAATLATLAFVGAVLHVLNHGIFKGLLFLNAGSMLHATGTQDLNKLGGLMKYMPLTAITALVASFSISGVPLFNGFVSKWTIYVAAIEGSSYARYLPVCAAIAILTSALTLASFIKFFGASFLTRTSALVKSRAHEGRLEVGWMMQVPQLALATLCALLGIVPAIGFQILQRVLESSRQGYGVALAANVPMDAGYIAGASEVTSAALFVPLALLGMLAFSLLISFAVSKAGAAQRRSAAPWLCGYAREAEANRYVAHNFYGEIKRYFGAGGVRHT